MSFLKKNSMYYIHIAIWLLITFGIGFLPPFAQITELGMKVLGVFLGVIYAWCFIALDWTSMVALCALAIAGFSAGDATFLQGWSFQTLPQMVLCFIFAEGIAQTRLTDYIANKMLSIKLFKGKPFVMVTGICVAMLIMNLLQCGLAGLFILWSLAAVIAEKAGYEKNNIFTTVIVASTVAVFVWSAAIFPFAPMTILQIGFLQQAMPGIQVPFFNWIALWLTFVTIYAVGWPLILKYIFRLDFSAIANIDFSELITNKDAMKMNTNQKFGLGVLIGFMAAMMVPKVLPATWTITTIFSSLGLSGCLALAIVIMVAFRNSEGKHYLTLQDAAKGIQWNVIWLTVATQPLGSAINSADCGIMASIMTTITPWLTSITPTMFLVAVVLILGITTQVVHNMVLMVVFIPILVPIYASMGGNPWIMFIGMYVALNAAFATPAASWNSAMMFGCGGVISKQMYIHGTMHFIWSLVLFFIIMLPMATVLLPY